MNTINTVVFDVGNVLLDWNPQDLFKDVFGRDDYDGHPLKKIIGSHLWAEMDRGSLSLNQLIQESVLDFPEEEETIRRFINEVADRIKRKDGGFECALWCKEKGYRILLLSNFGEEAWKRVTERFNEFALFEGGVISWEIGSVKPEEEIYKKLLNDYNLVPEKTLFIDDMAENVEAASQMGINVLHLPQEKNLKSELESLFSKST